MIKLFSLKQQKKDGDSAPERGKKASAAQLRIQKGEKREESDIFVMKLAWYEWINL